VRNSSFTFEERCVKDSAPFVEVEAQTSETDLAAGDQRTGNRSVRAIEVVSYLFSPEYRRLVLWSAPPCTRRPDRIARPGRLQVGCDIYSSAT